MKELENIKYIKAKVREIQENPEISFDKKKMIYDLGKKLFSVNKELNETDVWDSVEYGLRSFDMAYRLISGKSENLDKRLVQDVIFYSERIIDNLKDSEHCLEAIEKISDCLEAKVICNEVFEKAKKSNKKP